MAETTQLTDALWETYKYHVLCCFYLSFFFIKNQSIQILQLLSQPHFSRNNFRTKSLLYPIYQYVWNLQAHWYASFSSSSLPSGGLANTVTEHGGLKEDGTPDKRVGTGQFAQGQVDPHEAGKQGGQSSGGSTESTGSSGGSSRGNGREYLHLFFAQTITYAYHRVRWRQG
jgi:hypothetical protein